MFTLEAWTNTGRTNIPNILIDVGAISLSEDNWCRRMEEKKFLHNFQYAEESVGIRDY